MTTTVALQQDLDTFYELLEIQREKIGGYRYLSSCSGEGSWPQRGIYSFFEPGEYRKGGKTLRVVRVGTHAVSRGSKTTLWNRLMQHRGHTYGGGNHRGSVFRLLVGTALIGRGSYHGPANQSWARGNSAPKEIRVQEKDLESSVSAHIGKMPFLWVELDDTPGPESQRAYIERNAIALLSNIMGCPDIPSQFWLGRYCLRPDIRESGLWNSNHVRERYDPRFLTKLRSLIEPKEII